MFTYRYVESMLATRVFLDSNFKLHFEAVSLDDNQNIS